MASLTLLVASVMASSHGFVVCPDKEVAYFHVPKAAGLHVTKKLLDTNNDCILLWHILQSDDPRLRMDRCHVTPGEVGPFARRDADAEFAQIDVKAVRRYKSFTTVRHPYTRVLASFDERTGTGNAHTSHEWAVTSVKPPNGGGNDSKGGGFSDVPTMGQRLHDRLWPCVKPGCRHDPHLTRTVNGAGHTGPSRFCATSS